MDLRAQFCERCGRDSDAFASAHISFHDCPSCGVTCCSDCWNLVEAACLRCEPFRLVDTPVQGRTVVAPARAGDERSGATDPVVTHPTDTQGDGARARGIPRSAAAPIRGNARRPGIALVRAPSSAQASFAARVAAGAAAATATPALAAEAVDGGTRRRRHAGRIGIAASAAWVVVAALAVVTVGASPNHAQAPLGPTETPQVAYPPAVDVPASNPPPGTATPTALAQTSPPEHPSPGQAGAGSWAPPPGPSGTHTGNPNAVVTPPPGGATVFPLPSPSGSYLPWPTPGVTPAPTGTPTPEPPWWWPAPTEAPTPTPTEAPTPTPTEAPTP